jgi:hypothetical protein
LTPPVEHDEVTRAWRNRVGRTHPDLHLADPARAQAAATLTRALNAARDTLTWWIDEQHEWPAARAVGPTTVRFDEPDPWPERDTEPAPAPVCPVTGLRAGDRVRLWPFDGEAWTVEGTEHDARDDSTWVCLVDGERAVRADRVRLAGFSCPVCGACAGPPLEQPTIRPCPDCLIDLRRLERSPRDAARIRRAIEARARAGEHEAQAIGDERMVDRAQDRRRWAQRLAVADADDLQAALLGAFGRAWERWGGPVSADS